MNQKRSRYGQYETGSVDDWGDGLSASSSDDELKSNSRRSRKSSKSSAAKSKFAADSVVDASDKANCFLCKVGLFCDISIQSKTVPIVKLESKIREIIHRFIAINNSDIMMSDIRNLLNDDLKIIVTEQMDTQYIDLTLEDVKTHFFDCIIEPVLQARKSFDYWNSLFEKGKNMVIRADENGDPILDDKQVSTLAKIDAQRNASMYPRDPRLSIFFSHNLSQVPKNTGFGNPPRQTR